MSSRPMARETATGRAGSASSDWESSLSWLADLASSLVRELLPVHEAYHYPGHEYDCDDYGTREELKVHERYDEGCDNWERQKQLGPGGQSNRSGRFLSWINIKTEPTKNLQPWSMLRQLVPFSQGWRYGRCLEWTHSRKVRWPCRSPVRMTRLASSLSRSLPPSR